MTKGRLDKEQRQDDQRRKRAQAASALATGAKKSLKAIPVAAKRSRPSAARGGG